MSRQLKGLLLLAFLLALLFLAAQFNHTKTSSTHSQDTSYIPVEARPVPTPTRPEVQARVVVKTEIVMDGCHRDDFILLALINNLRANEGLKPLIINQELNRSATLKSQDINNHHYWAHTSPTGVTPWDFFYKVGYRYNVAGENLARNFNCDEQMLDAFMLSPTHKANILHKNYSEIGIGRDGDIVTLHFGEPLK